TGPAADHRPVLSERNPREAETRSDISERRIFREYRAESRRRICEDIPDVGLGASDFGRDRYEFVSQSKIERQGLGDLPIILEVIADERLPETRCCSRIERESDKPGRASLQERGEIGELVL